MATPWQSSVDSCLHIDLDWSRLGDHCSSWIGTYEPREGYNCCGEGNSTEPELVGQVLESHLGEGKLRGRF